MKATSFFGILLLVITIISFQNCGPVHEDLSKSASDFASSTPTNSGNGTAPANNDPPPQGDNVVNNNNNNNNNVVVDSATVFAGTLHPVLLQNCSGCHGNAQPPLHSVANAQVAHQNIMNANLVNLNNPAGSRLVQKIQMGHGAIPVGVAQDIQLAIMAWATDLGQ